MVLKNNVGKTLFTAKNNVQMVLVQMAEQRGAKLYLPLFKWYFRTTWGKTLFNGCSNGTLEQRGGKLYLPLFKWYFRTTWGKTLFTAVQNGT